MAQLGATSTSGNNAIMQRALHKSCPTCAAPGTYSNDELVRKGYTEAQIAEMLTHHPENQDKIYWFRRGWKEVYDPSRVGEPVGTICPCCGGPRASAKKLKTMKIRGRLF